MLEGEIRTWKPDIIAGAIAIIAVMATLLSGQLATTPALPWYETLAKPSFNPPTWVFAEVWATLYALMAYSLFRVLRMREQSQERTRAIILFFVMLALNAAWSWMFFGARSPLLGLINIVLQLAITLVNVGGVLEAQQDCSTVPGAAGRLGCVCSSAEFRYLVA